MNIHYLTTAAQMGEMKQSCLAVTSGQHSGSAYVLVERCASSGPASLYSIKTILGRRRVICGFDIPRNGLDIAMSKMYLLKLFRIKHKFSTAVRD